MRRLFICFATTFAATTAVGFAQPAAELTQNVIADNGNDGTIVVRSGLEADQAHGSAVGSPANVARANAHDCATGCQAIAAALQVALIPAGTTTQAPENLALATNVNCSHCGSFAYAYQYVVDVPRGAKLSAHVRAQIAGLRREVDQDVRLGLDYPTLDARLTGVAQRFRAAVDTDLADQHEAETGKHSSKTVRQHPAD